MFFWSLLKEPYSLRGFPVLFLLQVSLRISSIKAALRFWSRVNLVLIERMVEALDILEARR